MAENAVDIKKIIEEIKSETEVSAEETIPVQKLSQDIHYLIEQVDSAWDVKQAAQIQDEKSTLYKKLLSKLSSPYTSDILAQQTQFNRAMLMLLKIFYDKLSSQEALLAHLLESHNNISNLLNERFKTLNDLVNSTHQKVENQVSSISKSIEENQTANNDSFLQIKDSINNLKGAQNKSIEDIKNDIIQSYQELLLSIKGEIKQLDTKISKKQDNLDDRISDEIQTIMMALIGEEEEKKDE